MSQRHSTFARVPADLYQTPAWCVDALAGHINLHGLMIWEPACGQGQMVRALEAHGAQVFASDLHEHGFEDQAMVFDFASADIPRFVYFQHIITNCPYGPQGRLAERFIERGLERLPPGGILALLLQADFDSAGGRQRLFRHNRDFAGRIVLNRRIEWFPRGLKPGGSKEGGPSANHSWFVWQRRIINAPAAFTLYAPERVAA